MGCSDEVNAPCPKCSTKRRISKQRFSWYIWFKVDIKNRVSIIGKQNAFDKLKKVMIEIRENEIKILQNDIESLRELIISDD